MSGKGLAEVKKLDEPELPFDLNMADFAQEFFEFSKQIQLPVYGSPTVEELVFVQNYKKSDANNVQSMIDFAMFFINSRTGIKLSKSQVEKIPMSRLKLLMEFFNSETDSIKGDEGKKENPLTGLPSTGDLEQDTQPTEDLTPTNSGIAL